MINFVGLSRKILARWFAKFFYLYENLNKVIGQKDEFQRIKPKLAVFHCKVVFSQVRCHERVRYLGNPMTIQKGRYKKVI